MDLQKKIEELLNPIFKQVEQLQSENEKLKEALNNIPTNEYSEAQSNGCDSEGSWNCFLKALKEWREQALKKDVNSSHE